MAAPTPRRVWIARGLALAVDLVQIALPPVSALPFVDLAIDVATAVAMVLLVGWHWAFLPTFLAEAVPFVVPRSFSRKP